MVDSNPQKDQPKTAVKNPAKDKPAADVPDKSGASSTHPSGARMEYFHKFRSTVTQVAAQVSNALPGNPLTREYDVGELVATAGPGMYWKIFKGTKKSTKQVVAVWLFDKKDIEKWPKDDKELFLTIIKKGVSQLTRLRHPRLLTVEHGIEESRDSLAFATEPVFTSLANCLGHTENLSEKPDFLLEFKLLDIEIRHGLFQLGEALSFLHIDARILHRNICPQNVVISEKGSWKLSGFEFATQLVTPGTPNGDSAETLDWNERVTSVCQPALDYLAPEYIMGGRPCPNSDMFSFGALIYAVFNKSKPPLEFKNNLDKYRHGMEKVKAGSAQFGDNVPAVFKDDFKMCLNYTPELRPDANQLTKIAFFDDPLVKALNYFESLMQMDNNQKMQFFKTLPAILPKFEKRPLLQKVMPWLAAEFATPDLIPFILPSVFHIVEASNKSEFTSIILPPLIPVFTLQRPYQIGLLLLQQMPLLLERATDEDIRKYVLPLVYNSISSETTRIQELCLSIIPTIGKLVDRNSMKTQLLPKLLKLTTDGGVLAIRVQALVCIGKLLPNLESWMITEQILPTLPKISSKEPGLLMAILGIYKLAFENSNVGVSREQLAKSALPFLMASSIENTLNLGQFDQYMQLIEAMMAKVKTEQRSRLQQLSAGQEEQRGVPNFDAVLKPTNAALPQSLDGLDLGGSVAAPKKPTGVLTLEDKKRMAAERENQSTGGSTTTAKSTLSQLGSTPDFGLFGAAAGKPQSQPTSARAVTPLDDLFGPSPSAITNSSSTTGNAVDVSDFLPTNGDIFGRKPAASQPPTTLSFPTANQFSLGAVPASSQFAPPAPMASLGGFAPPPSSSNRAVHRPAPSSLDTLFSLPSQQTKPVSLNGGAARPVQPQKKDPFADLLD